MLASNQKGFTLVEIMIAILLLAFITIAVVTITENSINTKDRTTQLNEDNLQIETAMSRFEWDFSQIYSPLYFSTPMTFNSAVPGGAPGNPNAGAAGGNNATAAGGVGGGTNATAGGVGGGIGVNPALQQYQENLNMRFQVSEHFASVSKEGMPIPKFYSPEKTTFEFFTSSNRRKLENTRQSNYAWVRYTLGDHLEHPEGINGKEVNPNIPKNLKTFVRYFSADNPYSDKRLNVEDDKIKGAVLLENVEKLEFQFWNFDRRKWETNLKTIQGGENMLRGVRVMITWYDSAGQKRSADRFFRNHWPIFLQQDNASGTAAPTAGASAGTTAGAPAGANPWGAGGGATTSAGSGATSGGFN